MMIIGLTGGICSGKSTVAARFRYHAIPVISADDVAHEIMKPGSSVLDSVIGAFGREIVRDDGTLDRGKLRAIVFSHTEKKKKLESLTHPAIRKRMQELTIKATAPYLVQEIPLLVESNGQIRVDRILVVTCSVENQLERLVKERVLTPTIARKIIATQVSDTQRLTVADDVIENNQDLDTLQQAVDQMHLKYLAITTPSS